MSKKRLHTTKELFRMHAIRRERARRLRMSAEYLNDRLVEITRAPLLEYLLSSIASEGNILMEFSLSPNNDKFTTVIASESEDRKTELGTKVTIISDVGFGMLMGKSSVVIMRESIDKHVDSVMSKLYQLGSSINQLRDAFSNARGFYNGERFTLKEVVDNLDTLPHNRLRVKVEMNADDTDWKAFSVEYTNEDLCSRPWAGLLLEEYIKPEYKRMYD